MERAGGKRNSILGGDQGGASVGADWLTGLEGLTGELRVPGVGRTTREELNRSREPRGPRAAGSDAPQAQSRLRAKSVRTA